MSEMLRYNAPVQGLRRDAFVPIEVDDVSLAAGETLILMLGAAHRDPRRFPDPDRFDVGRADNHHLSFGSGIHHCLGAPVARVEARWSSPGSGSGSLAWTSWTRSSRWTEDSSEAGRR